MGLCSRISSLSSESLESEIVNALLSNSHTLFLVHGRSSSGKSEAINKINIKLLLNNKNISPLVFKGKSILGFLGLSLINNYSTAKLNFCYDEMNLSIEDGNIISNPIKGTIRYKKLFSIHKYASSKKNIFYPQRNILLLDDCETLSIQELFLLDSLFRHVFDSKLFFGGINVVLFGNAFKSTGTNNIFSSMLYSEKYNIFDKFKCFTLQCETNFTRNHSSLGSLYFGSDDITRNELLYHTNQFVKKRKFKKDLPFESIKKYGTSSNSTLLYSHCKKICSEYNKKCLKEYIEVRDKEQYDDTPVISTEDEVLVRSTYASELQTLSVAIGVPVITREGIRGVVKSVRKTEDRISLITIESDIDKKIISITKRNVSHNDKELFSYIPLILGWCSSLKYAPKLYQIDNREIEGKSHVLLLTSFIPLWVFEDYISKITHPRFIDTFNINCRDIFKQSYLNQLINNVWN